MESLLRGVEIKVEREIPRIKDRSSLLFIFSVSLPRLMRLIFLISGKANLGVSIFIIHTGESSTLLHRKYNYKPSHIFFYLLYDLKISYSVVDEYYNLQLLTVTGYHLPKTVPQLWRRGKKGPSSLHKPAQLCWAGEANAAELLRSVVIDRIGIYQNRTVRKKSFWRRWRHRALRSHQT